LANLTSNIRARAAQVILGDDNFGISIMEDATHKGLDAYIVAAWTRHIPKGGLGTPWFPNRRRYEKLPIIVLAMKKNQVLPRVTFFEKSAVNNIKASKRNIDPSSRSKRRMYPAASASEKETTLSRVSTMPG
jgi:hypothetical protein